MRRVIFRCGAAVLILGCALSIAAQDKGNWYAASSAAKSITGDIAIADLKVTINYIQFPLAPIRRLTPAEVSAAFDADANAGISGDLYRLRVPAGQRFAHKNTLCGTENAEWMATYVSGRTLTVSFFSGPDMPVFTMDALTNTMDRCGTFTYGR
jgi:hypothetical protein